MLTRLESVRLDKSIRIMIFFSASFESKINKFFIRSEKANSKIPSVSGNQLRFENYSLKQDTNGVGTNERRKSCLASSEAKVEHIYQVSACSFHQ